MDRKKLLIHIVCLMFFIFSLDTLAHKFYWYDSIWWFDMLTHSLSGFWVALFFIYVFVRKMHFPIPFVKVFFYLFLIGVGWEIFEFIVNNYIGPDPFDILDTLSDIFFDLAGGLSAIIYYWYTFRDGKNR